MITGLRNIASASKLVASHKGYVGIFGVTWLITLTLFLLISRSSVIAYMVTSPQFSTLTKLAFMGDIYRNFFTYLASPIVFTAFVFILLAALNITLLIYMTRIMQQQGSKASSAGAAGAVITSHILACGSSLLAPFFSALAGSSAYTDPGQYVVASIFGTSLNLIGVFLILRSSSGIAARILYGHSST